VSSASRAASTRAGARVAHNGNRAALQTRGGRSGTVAGPGRPAAVSGAGARNRAAAPEAVRARRSTTADTVVAVYSDAAGVVHRLRVERSPERHWRVLDDGPGGVRLIEELTGPGDDRPQAEALARDYATQAALAARVARGELGDEIVWAA
jgi:hypothetical protein